MSGESDGLAGNSATRPENEFHPLALTRTGVLPRLLPRLPWPLLLPLSVSVCGESVPTVASTALGDLRTAHTDTEKGDELVLR